MRKLPVWGAGREGGGLRADGPEGGGGEDWGGYQLFRESDYLKLK